MGLSVYVVAGTCVIGIPLHDLLRNEVDIAYIIHGFMTTFCTTLSLCFVFVPKVSYHYFKFLLLLPWAEDEGEGMASGASEPPFERQEKESLL